MTTKQILTDYNEICESKEREEEKAKCLRKIWSRLERISPESNLVPIGSSVTKFALNSDGDLDVVWIIEEEKEQKKVKGLKSYT